MTAINALRLDLGWQWDNKLQLIFIRTVTKDLLRLTKKSYFVSCKIFLVNWCICVSEIKVIKTPF